MGKSFRLVKLILNQESVSISNSWTHTNYHISGIIDGNSRLDLHTFPRSGERSCIFTALIRPSEYRMRASQKTFSVLRGHASIGFLRRSDYFIANPFLTNME